LSPGSPVALLDANVLYSARLRDLFVRLAIAGLYRARWSEQILDECFANLVADRPDIPPAYLERTRALMALAVPDAVVAGYEQIVEQLDLPDADDRHVLVTAGAAVIVTFNLADFTSAVLAEHRIEALSPGAFVHRLVIDDIDAVAELIDRQAADLRNPPMSTTELLDGLEAVGLDRAVAMLRSGTENA
jgi:hypothetical protein